MPLSSRSVLVTGATGFLGGRLVEKLALHSGAEVRALVRNFSHASRIARFEIEMVPGDISDKAAVEEAARGCDIVFHCAYDFSGGSKQRARENVRGTDNVAKVALQNGARLVHVSTVDVYGWPPRGDLDESAPRRAAGSTYAETKLAAEELVLRYYEQNGLLATVVQPTIIYGPFSGPWTLSPVHQLKTGKVVLSDCGEGYCNAVYVDDVVDVLLLAATQEQAIGQTFLVSASEPITWRGFYEAYEKVLGIKAVEYWTKEQVEESLKQQHRDASELRRFLSLLRDRSVHARLMRLPLVGWPYRSLHSCLPQHFRESLKSKVLKTRSATDGDAETVGNAKLWLPDLWRLRLQRSHARVCIEKAQTMLGYKPKFDFEQGMSLTAQYIEWANLV